MPDEHPSGDPDVNRQHIKKQRKGDKELTEKPGPSPGSGRPDAEEGAGTEQNQKR